MTGDCAKNDIVQQMSKMATGLVRVVEKSISLVVPPSFSFYIERFKTLMLGEIGQLDAAGRLCYNTYWTKEKIVVGKIRSED